MVFFLDVEFPIDSQLLAAPLGDINEDVLGSMSKDMDGERVFLVDEHADCRMDQMSNGFLFTKGTNRLVGHSVLQREARPRTVSLAPPNSRRRNCRRGRCCRRRSWPARPPAPRPGFPPGS